MKAIARHTAICHTLIRSISLLLCMGIYIAKGQAVYKMGNQKVYLCKGKLTDSEGYLHSPKKYANNENYTFSVTVKGAGSIDLKFNGAFCTESKTDYLKIYSGKDTSGTLLRTMTGTINTPAALTVPDSSVTFYFHSNASNVCDGWDLDWESKITSAPQPLFLPITEPKCNTVKLRLTLDHKLDCDSVKADNFKLTGPLTTAVTFAKAVNCDNKNQSDVFDITFASGLDRSGSYTLAFNGSMKDACDSVWKVNAKLNFKITDCPISVYLYANKYYVCKGSCATLNSFVFGGNLSNHAYTWLSGGLTGAPPKTVCPSVTTRYILQVSDGFSNAGKDTIDIVVVDPPKTQNDTTVCQSGGAFRLSGYPAGGYWFGKGITSGVNGTFDPMVSGGGMFTVYYYVGTCRDSVIVTVKTINPGPTVAACPGSAPFMAAGFSPAGGAWSGPNITGAGLITPTTNPGTFQVQYTLNGCIGVKQVNIGTIVMPHRDTICRSKALDTFIFHPVGGAWTGPAVSNLLLGSNTPPYAGIGDKVYIYSINGCKDTLKRYIRSVDAGFDEIACPDAGRKTLPAGLPAGGWWSGKGILDPNAGIFDADSFKVPGKSTFAQSSLIYHATNGCEDEKIMFLRYTKFYWDTIRNCVSDTPYFMRYQRLLNDPWNMYFTGSSAISGNQIYYQKFNPSKAGRGSWNRIIGEANGCRDTLMLFVFGRSRIQKDTAFCITDDPVKLYNAEGPGYFFGPGITNGFAGIFNPAVADTGKHLIYFSIFGKCLDTIRITVNPVPRVSLTGLKTYYCMKDTVVNLGLSPLGGILSGKGVANGTFNPRYAGSGSHTVSYTYGIGRCINKSIKQVTVGDTLKLSLSSSKDTICPGTAVIITAKAGGGNGNYSNYWSSGEFNKASVSVTPKQPVTYKVLLKDGCSDSVVKTSGIFVHPSLYGKVNASPVQCYGKQGYVKLSMTGGGPYKFSWNAGPQQSDSVVRDMVGSRFNVKVYNTKTGCTYDTVAEIPGYPRIRAYFETLSFPGQCVYKNTDISFINRSEGGIAGKWDFGDGQLIPYDGQDNPLHAYTGDKDVYKVSLLIENEGKCRDSFSMDVCILDTVTIFIPTAFSPNNDGTNDVFIVEAGSVDASSMEIYNRWGELMYTTDNPARGWNGYYMGKLCPPDYYIYVVKYRGRKTAWKHQKGYFYLLK